MKVISHTLIENATINANFFKALCKFKTVCKATAILLLGSCILSGCTAVLKASTSDPINMDPSKRSLGTYIDDKQIEAIAEINLEKSSQELRDAGIHVHAYNGVVLLTGQIPSKKARKQAAQIVSSLAGVRQVHNQLQLISPRNWISHSHDTWITAKVKSQFMINKDIKSRRIKVITENGIVYLMGRLTPALADKAARIASSVKGTVKVVKVIEYLS